MSRHPLMMRRYLDRRFRNTNSIVESHLPVVLKPYHYIPLSGTIEGRAPSIRVLLLKGTKTKGQALAATLQESPLDAIQRHYEALSYTWGLGDFTEVLIIDGKALKITKNLHNALRRLREAETRHLWVDAICINQADLSERTSQVAIMPRIYARSRQTLIWLGEPREEQNAEAVVDFIVKGALHCRDLPPGETCDIGDLCLEVARHQQAESFQQVVTPHNVDRFFNMTYFSRRWIIQEILLAPEVQVVWGHHELPWKDVHICIRGMSSVTKAEHGRLGAMAFKDTAWDSLQPDGSNILALMYRFQSFECQDPRDRIAALTGLWQNHEKPMSTFWIDYARSVETNYLHFAMAVSQTSDCGQLLMCAALRNISLAEKGKPLQDPSWVPDWRHDPFTTMPTKPRMEYPAALFIGGVVALRGWIVDTVVRANRSNDFIKEIKADPIKHGLELRLLDANPDRYRRTLECALQPDRVLVYNRFLHRGVVQPGDKICTFFPGESTSDAQFVLREVASNSYLLIGICTWSQSLLVKGEIARAVKGIGQQDPVQIVLV